MIPIAFINHASEILGNTDKGLSGNKIIDYCSAYAVKFSIDIPYAEYPFKDVINKRTALKENLKVFESHQQFLIIKELCELDQFKDNSSVKDLKIKLISRYSYLSDSDISNEINETLIEETKHWLSDYPESLKLYETALQKYENDIYQRNILDDLRLSLEKLVKSMLQNNKPLEKQLIELGQFVKIRNGSKELQNMFTKLIDYYTKYQNTYVKHGDKVIESEIEILFEITSSFMKFLIRIR